MSQVDQTVSMQLNAQFSQANTAIDSVISKLKSLSTTIGEIANVSLRLKTLSKNMEKLATINLSNLASNASSLNQTATAVSQLATGLKSLKGVSGSVTSLSTAMNKLNNVDVSKTTATMESLSLAVVKSSKVLANADYSKLQRLIETFTNLTKAVNTYEQTLARMNKTMNKTKASKMQSVMNGAKRSVESTDKSVTRLSKSLSNMMNFGKMYAWYNQIRHFGKIFMDILNKPIAFGETENYFSVAFGEMRDEAYKFGTDLAEAFGLSLPVIMQMQATFKNMIGSLGGVTEEVSTMISEVVTKMTIDYASLYNVSIENASQKFQSALSRQVRPIRSTSGYDITSNVLGGTLQDIGITDRAMSQLSEMEKRLLVIITLQHQMNRSGALQDFARTIEQPANQLKILTEQLSELGRAFGSMFTASIAKVLPYINAFVMTLKDMVMNLAFIFGYELPQSTGATGTVLDSYDDTLSDVNDSLTDIGDTTDSNYQKTKKWKNFLAGFDVAEVIPTMPEYNSSGGSTSGGGVSANYVDPRILGALKDYDNLMYSIDMKANKLKSKIEGIFSIIGKWVSKNIFKPISESWNTYSEPIMEKIEGIKDKIAPIFEDFGKTIDGNFSSLVSSVSNLVFSSINIILGFVDTIIDAVALIWENGGQGLVDGFTRFLQGLADFKTALNDYFIEPFLDGLSIVFAPFATLIGGILGLIGDLLEYLGRFLTFLSDSRELIEIIGSLIAGFAFVGLLGSLGGISTAFLKLIDAIKKLVSVSIIGKLIDGFRRINEMLLNSGLVQSIFGFGSNLASAGTAAGGLAGTLKTILGKAFMFIAQHPAATLAIAIGGIVLAITKLGKASKEKKYDMDDFSESVQNQIKKVQDLDSDLSDLASRYEESFADATAEAETLEKCLGDIKAAEVDGIVTADELPAVQAAIDELNGKLGDTVVTVEDGKIAWNENEQAIKDRIETLKESAIEEAKIQLYTQYVKDRTAAEVESNRINGQILDKQKEINSLKKARDDAFARGDTSEGVKYDELWQQAKADLAGLEEAQTICTDKIYEMDDAISTLDSELEENTEKTSNAKKNIEKFYDSMKVDQATKNNMESMIDNYAGLESAMENAKKEGKEWSESQKQDVADAKRNVIDGLADMATRYDMSYDEIEKFAKDHHIDLTEEDKKYYEEAVKNAKNAHNDIKNAMPPIKQDVKFEEKPKLPSKKTLDEWKAKLQEKMGGFAVNITAKTDSIKRVLENFFKTNVFDMKGQIVVKMPGANVGSSLDDIYLSPYASGGFPSVGELFIARENGPEMVGTIGGSNAVANNNQIVDGIASGVYQAMKSALSHQGGDIYLTIKNSDGSTTRKIIRDYNNFMKQNGGKGGFVY